MLKVTKTDNVLNCHVSEVAHCQFDSEVVFKTLKEACDQGFQLVLKQVSVNKMVGSCDKLSLFVVR